MILNQKLIAKVLSAVASVVGAAMLLPAAVSAVYKEWDVFRAFLLCALPVLAAGEIQPEPADTPPESADLTAEIQEPALPKRAYTGCIRVHTVTAEGARPVAGAAVTVVRFVSTNLQSAQWAVYLPVFVV